MHDDILWIDNPQMQQVSQPVRVFDADLKAVVAHLFAVMERVQENALAAIQLGVPQRIIAIVLSEEERYVMINPVITSIDAEKYAFQEVCSSLPDYPIPTQRARHLVVDYQDIDGNAQRLACADNLAVLVQHLCEHLDNHSLLDGLSPLKKARVLKAIHKRHPAHGLKKG